MHGSDFQNGKRRPATCSRFMIGDQRVVHGALAEHGPVRRTNDAVLQLDGANADRLINMRVGHSKLLNLLNIDADLAEVCLCLLVEKCLAQIG